MTGADTELHSGELFTKPDREAYTYLVYSIISQSEAVVPEYPVCLTLLDRWVETCQNDSFPCCHNSHSVKATQPTDLMPGVLG